MQMVCAFFYEEIDTDDIEIELTMNDFLFNENEDLCHFVLTSEPKIWCGKKVCSPTNKQTH